MNTKPVTVKKQSVSIDLEIREAALQRAAEMFPNRTTGVGNFSAYVNKLIRADLGMPNSAVAKAGALVRQAKQQVRAARKSPPRS